MHDPGRWKSPKDVDLVCTYAEFQNFIERLGIQAIPTGDDRFVGKLQDGRMVEFEIAWPGSSGVALLDRASGLLGSLHGFTVLYPSIDWLFTIKASHRYKKNSPHFWKTAEDYHHMKDVMGCKIADEKWLQLREKETYTASRPKLNVSKKDFFTDDVPYKYDHDTLHLAVAHLDQPAYEYYRAEGQEVMCSKEKWDACSEEIKLYGVLEEVYVLALERSQIPFGDSVSPYDSFRMALMKVCTSITSGWFREFAYENVFKILEMFPLTGQNYVDKFKVALAAGIVKEVEQ